MINKSTREYNEGLYCLIRIIVLPCRLNTLLEPVLITEEMYLFTLVEVIRVMNSRVLQSKRTDGDGDKR